MKKISEVLSENFHFLVVKFSVYLNRLVFVMRNMLLFKLFVVILLIFFILWVDEIYDLSKFPES